MSRNVLLYEGKAKKIYSTEDPDQVRVEYKDDATAFNGEKKGQIPGKGELNNRISAFFFESLGREGIRHHFLRTLSPREQLVKHVKILPVEVVVRNRAAGSLASRLGIEEGTVLSRPVVEFYLKDDKLGDPLINEDHIALLQLATGEQVTGMRETALRVNEHLTELMAGKGIILVDFKLEFGVDSGGKLLLADEISPDTCRFWDLETGEKLDKDRFRRDLGHVEEAYRQIWHRLGGEAHV
ncbi:phosphoribosylaminoimidazole-succinocarboxamide synthase [Kroppenstedtia guangzhouensis]|uniref:Phosphoribosylaminoimidazole-succinocarboxamide synthase n=1 Tax=Kroppenstedtia guangzhouensis TaxID=1274356 RepID=A0ABQ1GYT7_9BACL|nr:phosphoribosylaminoimidazolesuccinocarboxamide synthase [Kroppenstedtia guangzhouensis]GGA53051.1 phosphoribosylaminoimidazole-succinocarboxamide synthase [Kroppenstedtia guangzhouensis]